LSAIFKDTNPSSRNGVAMLDPDAQIVLNMNREAARPPIQTLTPAEARQGMRQSRTRLSPDPPDVAECRDLACPGPAGPISLRLYRGLGLDPAAAVPGVLFFHGGGWVMGDLDTHDVTCRLLANAAGCAVIAVDYRLAPEHPFPAAADDAYAAFTWLAEHAPELAIDPARLAVCGDSAGGNLAAVVALMARERGGPALRAQVLVYPVVDLSLTQGSFATRADGFTLTRDAMTWFRDVYTPDRRHWTDWRAAPLHAPHHRDLPPAHIVTAGYDPLCDEGAQYAERLRAHGVAVDHKHYEGQMHGFLGAGKIIRAAGTAIGEIGSALRSAFRA
jgi:acetyl esterase